VNDQLLMANLYKITSCQISEDKEEGRRYLPVY